MLMDVLSNVNNIVFAASESGTTLANGLRDFIGPILMLIMGIVAITFLFQRQMTQFVIFIVIAIVVAIIFYGPGIIENIAKDVSGTTGGESW